MVQKTPKTQKEFDRLASAMERLFPEPSSQTILEGQLSIFEAMSNLSPETLAKKISTQLARERAQKMRGVSNDAKAQERDRKKVQRYLLDLNVYNWLLSQKELSKQIAFNKFKHEVQFRNIEDDVLRDWREEDDYDILIGVQEQGINAGINHVRLAVNRIAKLNSFDPIIEWLDDLKWDGVERLDRLVPYYFNCEDTAYTRAIGRMFMISAVARQYEPDCQVDHLLILEGSQGLYKTRGLEALFGKVLLCMQK